MKYVIIISILQQYGLKVKENMHVYVKKLYKNQWII
jgi:hypothetical protein